MHLLSVIFSVLLLIRLSYLYGRNQEHHSNWYKTNGMKLAKKNCSKINALGAKSPERNEQLNAEMEDIAKNKYTIVVSTYNRDNELVKNVDHWLSCPHLHQVQVVWHNPNREPPALLTQIEKEHNCSSPNLLVRKQMVDMLSNRFRAPKNGFQTDAVFNIDDDAVIDCRMMTAAFKQWQKLGPDSMVGFEPRQIDWNGSGQGYTWWAACLENQCKYNTLWPTKGSFLHKKFYQIYWSKKYSKVRKLVDNYFTGEDILMTFIHFHNYYDRTKENPPILSVQATTNFERSYLDKTDRFNTMQKIAHLPEVVIFKTGIGEATSLGARSSWHRSKITESIGALARKIASPMVVPPMTESWYFVDNHGLSGYYVDLPCNKPELLPALTCSTKVSLTVLNTTDAELMCLVILVIGLLFCYGCYKLQKHRAKVMAFEEIRARKVSVVNPMEANLKTIPTNI